MKLQPNKNHYLCEQCNGYNDILNMHCIYCNFHRNSILSSIAIQVIYERSGLQYHQIHMEELNLQTATDDERASRHNKFYNEEIIAVSKLDDNELRLRLEELIDIDFEVKARVNAINAETRKRRASKTNAQRSWMQTTDDSVVASDAIANVKARKARQSKGDRMYDNLVNTLGKEEADKIMSGVAKFQSNGSQTSFATSETYKHKSIEEKPKPKSEPLSEEQLKENDDFFNGLMS